MQEKFKQENFNQKNDRPCRFAGPLSVAKQYSNNKERRAPALDVAGHAKRRNPPQIINYEMSSARLESGSKT